MDFGALPPEVNSGRMYSGSGSAPLLAAAAAWEDLAVQLHAAAASYQYQIELLVDTAWRGPSSASMAAAGATYITWLTGTAAQAGQTATQAKAAAGAFEEAFSMTVPPPVITANRSLLMSLIITNIFGQNTPAIAATEAQYREMWAQDTAAMYGYAGASASAATLTPFTPPPTVANPLSPSVLTSALQGLASPLQSASVATAPTGGLVGVLQSLGFTSPLSLLTPANTGLTATSLSGASAAWGSASHADATIISMQDQISGTENRIMSRFDEWDGWQRRRRPPQQAAARCRQLRAGRP